MPLFRIQNPGEEEARKEKGWRKVEERKINNKRRRKMSWRLTD